MKKNPKKNADALLDILLDTAESLVRTLHEAVKQADGDKTEIRSIKEWTGAAKELTALVKSLGERETQAASTGDRITVRFLEAEEFTK